jgi:hypothetical protein
MLPILTVVVVSAVTTATTLFVIAWHSESDEE